MTGTTTRDNGNLRVVGVVGTTVDDFVFRIEAESRVGDGEGVKGGLDKVGGIREEVFCWREVSSALIGDEEEHTLHGEGVGEGGGIRY